ncbi:MAG: hypothetical protein KF713_08075 [Turneriella sp.]|nr:hypothetical protein [Turneriella sp.]
MPAAASQNTPRAIAFKITAIVLVAYFTFAAIIYFSNPDPVHWMLFYIVCAVCCLLTVLRKDSLPLLYIAIGMGVMELASTADGFLTVWREGPEAMSVAKAAIAGLRRDFFGALVSILVCVCLAIRLRRVTQIK